MDNEYVKISRESFCELVRLLDEIIDELPSIPHFRRRELHVSVNNLLDEVLDDGSESEEE